MPRYILSPAAKASLRQIKSWSESKFGAQVTSEYLGNWRQKMRDLAEQPASGTPRPEMKSGYFSSFVGSHTIYYRVADSGIEVIDVLHQRMEPKLHL